MRLTLVTLVAVLALAGPAAAAAAPSFTLVGEAPDRFDHDRRYLSWLGGTSVRVYDTKTGAARSYPTPEGCGFRDFGGANIAWQCRTEGGQVARILDIETGALNEIAITWNSQGGLWRVGAEWAAIVDEPDPHSGFSPGSSWYRIASGERNSSALWDSDRHVLDADHRQLYRKLCSPIRRLPDRGRTEVWEPRFLRAEYELPFARVYSHTGRGTWYLQRCGSRRRTTISSHATLRAGWLTWAKRGVLTARDLRSRRTFRWRFTDYDPDTERVVLSHTTRRLVLTVGPLSGSGATRVYTARFPR